MTLTLACTEGRKGNVSIHFFVIQKCTFKSVHTSITAVCMSQCGLQSDGGVTVLSKFWLPATNDCHLGEYVNSVVSCVYV